MYVLHAAVNGIILPTATQPSQLGWTWAADVCHMMKVCFDTNDSWDSMLYVNMRNTACKLGIC